MENGLLLNNNSRAALGRLFLLFYPNRHIPKLNKKESTNHKGQCFLDFYGILCVGIILTAPSGAQNNLPSSRLVSERKTYRGFAPASPNPSGSYNPYSSDKEKSQHTERCSGFFVFGDRNR